MKSILVIDDLRVMNLLSQPVSYARTSRAAIMLLSATQHLDLYWDEVWWDHDLGGSDTTIPVLNLLEQWKFEGKPARIGLCVVHTSNPVGAKTLTTSLNRMYQTVRVDSALYSSETIG